MRNLTRESSDVQALWMATLLRVKSPDESQHEPLQDSGIKEFITGTPKPPASRHRDGPPTTRNREDIETSGPSALVGGKLTPNTWDDHGLLMCCFWNDLDISLNLRL